MRMRIYQFWSSNSSKVRYVVHTGKLCKISLLQYFPSDFVLSIAIYKSSLYWQYQECHQFSARREQDLLARKRKYHDNSQKKKQAVKKRYHDKSKSIRLDETV